MARTARETRALTPVVATNPAAEQRIDDAAREAHREEAIREQQAIALRRDFGLPAGVTQRELEDDCRFLIHRTAECALHLGARLCVLREIVPHGEWAATLDRIEVEDRAARRVMQAAMRFSNRSSTTVLVAAAHSKTKLFELMVLDDEDLESLEAGATVGALDKDALARMSVKELRSAVREIRADKVAAEAAKDKVIEGQRNHIASLQERLAKAEYRVEQSTPDQVLVDLQDALAVAAEHVRAAVITGLEARAHALQTHGVEHGAAVDDLIAGTLRGLGAELTALGGRLGMDLADQFAWTRDQA